MKYKVAVGFLNWEERFWSSVMVLSGWYCSYVMYLDADVRQVRTYTPSVTGGSLRAPGAHNICQIDPT
jgi:hypothetical protein